MRAAVARHRKMPLDEGLIAKLALFERCTDGDAIRSFGRLVNNAQSGKVDLLKSLEATLFEDDEAFESQLPKEWQKHKAFIQDWLKLDPPLGGVDLRAVFYLSRETLPVQAKEETRTVNAIVFPEYALSHAVFDRVCTALKGVEKELEFVVSGSSTNCDNNAANTVLTRVWQMRDKGKHLTNSRRKHHRWRLDRRQVEMYGLGTALNPKIKSWWEDTPVGQRELHFHRFRQSSVFAALICEELGRSDVCHDILRAVGPNLVFALLMDSAQLPGRWPGQYAAALADDPGCAVLSLTS